MTREEFIQRYMIARATCSDSNSDCMWAEDAANVYEKDHYFDDPDSCFDTYDVLRDIMKELREINATMKTLIEKQK